MNFDLQYSETRTPFQYTSNLPKLDFNSLQSEEKEKVMCDQSNEFQDMKNSMISPVASQNRAQNCKYSTFDLYFQEQRDSYGHLLLNDKIDEENKVQIDKIRSEFEKEYEKAAASLYDDQQELDVQMEMENTQAQYANDPQALLQIQEQVASNENIANRRLDKRQRKAREKTERILSRKEKECWREQKIQECYQTTSIQRQKSQRNRKPSQKFLESVVSEELTRQLEGNKKDQSKSHNRRSQSDNENLGSRSTSEKSSYQQSKEFNSIINETELTNNQPVVRSSRGRTVRNPIHEDYVQFDKLNKSSQVNEAEQGTRLRQKVNTQSIQKVERNSDKIKQKQQNKKILNLKPNKNRVNKMTRSSFIHSSKTLKQKLVAHKYSKLKAHPKQRKDQYQIVEGSSKEIPSPQKQIEKSHSNLQETSVLKSSSSGFLIQIPNFEKKKSVTTHHNNQYNFNDIIMSAEISGKIDTSKWINQANIVTPNFKKSNLVLQADSDEAALKFANSCGTNKNKQKQQQEKSNCEQNKQNTSIFAISYADHCSWKKNLNAKFDDLKGQQLPLFQTFIQKKFEAEHEENKRQKIQQEQQTSQLLSQIKECKNDSDSSEGEEETDDEFYIQRHNRLEEEEVVKYSIGLQNKKQFKQHSHHQSSKEVRFQKQQAHDQVHNQDTYQNNSYQQSTFQNEQTIEDVNKEQKLANASISTKCTSINASPETKILKKRSQKNSSFQFEEQITKQKNNKRQRKDSNKQQLCTQIEQQNLIKQQSDNSLGSYNLRKTIGIERDYNFIYEKPINLKKKAQSEKVFKKSDKKLRSQSNKQTKTNKKNHILSTIVTLALPPQMISVSDEIMQNQKG